MTNKNQPNRDIRKGQFWRHVKTGGMYFVTGFCVLELTDKIAVLYVEETADDDALSWARDKDEFLDGRFEHVKL